MMFTGFCTWIVAIFLLATVIFTPEPDINNLPTVTPPPIELDHDILMLEVNNYRIREGLRPFSSDTRTCEIAQTRIKDIVTHFSHDGFSAERLCGGYYCQIGEVLARNYPNEKETLQGWINSEMHKYIIEGNYQTACAATDGSYGVVIMASW